MKDNNILIANFLGWKGVDDGYDTRELIDEDIYNWGAIMAVVDKIESLGNYGFTIYRKSVNINGLPFELANTRGITKLEAVYNACVEFIEWWNRRDEV